MIIYKVAELTRYLKDVLESDNTLRDLWVAGELSNCIRAPSGHLYFTIRDADSQLSCVMWRSQAARLTFAPRDGLAVILHGYISVYETRGAYQLYADTMQKEGTGVLAAQFEELKGRLQAEGLFAQEHKRPLPQFPRRIGVVTSASGAVLHDIYTVLRRRFPLATLVLAAAAVQGDEAPRQLIAALAALQAHGNVDVMIIARGGGSLEDLWAFNDEGLARAIYNCAVPIISAVGHEVDVTIADFVADVRAPTPSAAAELVAPDQGEIATLVDAMRRRLSETIEARLDEWKSRLAVEQRTLLRLSPRSLLDRQRQRVDDLWQRARTRVTHDMELHRERSRGLEVQLRALSPLAVLERGFAIVWRDGGREVVSHVQQVRAGDRLQVQVSDGRFGAVADGDTRRKRSTPNGQGGQLPLQLE